MRKVIDVESLQVWKSVADCAKELNISKAAVVQDIKYNGRTRGNKKKRLKGHKLEYFDYWVQLDPEVKEQYTRENNIFFFGVDINSFWCNMIYAYRK